jgi:hypothetical protein
MSSSILGHGGERFFAIACPFIPDLPVQAPVGKERDPRRKKRKSENRAKILDEKGICLDL